MADKNTPVTSLYIVFVLYSTVGFGSVNRVKMLEKKHASGVSELYVDSRKKTLSNERRFGATSSAPERRTEFERREAGNPGIQEAGNPGSRKSRK